MNVNERLRVLRTLMQERSISAVIIPGTDPHSSEYSPEYWKEREWISGFDGSAGTVVVTHCEAVLWTDSRYFLQAEEQLKGSSIRLFKDGVMGTLSVLDFLKLTLKAGESVSINPAMFSVNETLKLQEKLNACAINLVTDYDLIGEVWTQNRESLPLDSVFILPESYSGKSAIDKITEIRHHLVENNCTAALYSGLDEVAWLYNIRGSDVKYNPVVIAYAYIDLDKAYLFVNSKKITDEVSLYLHQNGITLCDYLEINDFINHLPKNTRLALDFDRINFALYQKANCEKKSISSAIIKAKSMKNKTELMGVRSAMIRDGVAMVKFLKWLEDTLSKQLLTELSVAEKLKSFREEQQLFVGESFNTIAGYGAHGAIVHYSATLKSDAQLATDNFLLLDSGGQYFDGTTDITRTIALGEPTEQQKIDFTLVLKGHIALAQAKFPYGTRGVQLDILARQYLWKQGLNYGHGTGHGVGHFLCVHEGPHSIRTDLNATILEKGMIISNEPGLYRTNQYGIRIENLVTVVENESNEFGHFLSFETLTLCPIDKKAIDVQLLSRQEIDWLNQYHKVVYERIAPLVDEPTKRWLYDKTCEL